MRPITVCGEATGETKSRSPTGDYVQYSSAGDRADDLRDYVWEHFGSRETLSCAQANGHRRIEVTSGDVTDRIRHCQNCQTKSECYTQQTDSHIRKRRGKHSAAAATQYQ